MTLIARQRAYDPVTLPAETGDQDVNDLGVVVDHENSGDRDPHHRRELPSSSEIRSPVHCDRPFLLHILLCHPRGRLGQYKHKSLMLLYSVKRFCATAELRCAAVNRLGKHCGDLSERRSSVRGIQDRVVVVEDQVKGLAPAVIVRASRRTAATGSESGWGPRRALRTGRVPSQPKRSPKSRRGRRGSRPDRWSRRS